MTETAKLPSVPMRAGFRSPYFTGCNTGGHQALMEAQRFPDDYDGIVAGAPAADRVHEIIGYLGVWEATHKNGSSLLPQNALELITKAAVSSCDKVDGVKDGVLDDPRRCKFDPAALMCRGTETSECLSAEQVAAAKKVYAGVRNPRTGERIFPGWPLGSEGFGETSNSGWGQMIDIQEPRRAGFFQYFVFNNANWDWRTFAFDRDAAYADAKMVHQRDRAIRRLHARRQAADVPGWVDPILPAEDVVEYYEAVTKTMGGPAKTMPLRRSWSRNGPL
jgi:feruloyl esterase